MGDGDAELLFELFNEVDESGNMLLEEAEVRSMLHLLDPVASDKELKRYIGEIDLSEGPLNFASLLDWWDQAQRVPNSLVAEKGTALIASIRARAASQKMMSYISGPVLQKRWDRAKAADQLEALRDSYIRTISEVREYRIEQQLRRIETECASV